MGGSQEPLWESAETIYGEERDRLGPRRIPLVIKPTHRKVRDVWGTRLRILDSRSVRTAPPDPPNSRFLASQEQQSVFVGLLRVHPLIPIRAFFGLGMFAICLQLRV